MDKTKKKTIRRYILWGVMALIVIALTVMPLMARQQQAEDGPAASILATSAKVGSVRTTVHGGGTLEAGDPENIEVPKDVKITEFLVKNGDMVSEGDPLAEVDKVSVMTAITEIQDSMTTVRKQMESVRDEKASTTVSATAGGRVKKVYAKEGDRVESVLLAHGALAVLSLDGRMSVTLNAASELSTGHSVAVTLADGTEVTGRVESNLSGELVVTVEDKGYEVGQTVTVADVGEGTLEIHCPWSATAFTGTVSRVYAKEEQALSSGAALFTLKDTDYTAQLEILADTHREYEQLLQKLFKMYETGVITAPCDGMISGIDKDSAHLLAAEEEAFTVQLLTAHEGDYQLVLLNGEVALLNDKKCTNDSECTLKDGDPNHEKTCPHACNKKVNCRATSVHFSGCPHNCTMADKCEATFHKDGCPEKCTGDLNCKVSNPEKHQDSCPRKCTNADGCQAIYHNDSCITLCTHADEEKDCTAEVHYADCIWSCIDSKNADTVCPATKHKEGCYFYEAAYTAQVFKVSAVGTQELVGFIDPTSYTVLQSASGWVRADGQAFDTSLLIQSATMPASNAQQFQEGDIVLFITVYKGDESKSLAPVLYQRSSSTSTTVPGMTMPGISGSFTIPSMGSNGGASSSQTQLYDLNGDVLMTVTPQDTMTLTISVDESDISSLKPGMSAEITVNALPGEEFEGEITRVAMSGSGNGGSSKFDVKLELPRQSEMLSGMSASAVIPLYEKMNVLTVPAAALVDTGAKTMVYTALDQKTGEPSAPVEVTTGISDGEIVEILSGLQSGDSVYYYYYDTLEESDAVETDRFQMK